MPVPASHAPICSKIGTSASQSERRRARIIGAGTRRFRPALRLAGLAHLLRFTHASCLNPGTHVEALRPAWIIGGILGTAGASAFGVLAVATPGLNARVAGIHADNFRHFPDPCARVRWPLGGSLCRKPGSENRANKHRQYRAT